MSKPAVRIVLTVLISLAVLAGIFSTVQSAASSVGVKVGQAHVTAGLLPDTSHPRNAPQTLQGSDTQLDPYMKGGGGCEDENLVHPDD